jgi:DNA-binding CsgD family transcriptional regulator
MGRGRTRGGQSTRDRQIADRWQRGESILQIANRFDLSAKRVSEILDRDLTRLGGVPYTTAGKRVALPVELRRHAKIARDRAIVTTRLAGSSLATIARRFELSEWTVKNILSATARDQAARGDSSLSDKLYQVARRALARVRR